MTDSFYVVREGDTLTSIAARLYGDPTVAFELADLNDLRDPRSVKVGQSLRLL